MAELQKRTWVYVHKPATYEIHCDKCGGNNLEWSEWEGMVWCYDCEVDTKSDGGVFAGPIAPMAMGILGISLDRIELATGRRLRPLMKDGKVEYVSVGEDEYA